MMFRMTGNPLSSKEGSAVDFDLHFTGSTDTEEIRAIQVLLDEYQPWIEFYYYYEPFGGFSLELKFSDPDRMLACRRAYLGLFTPSGSLKKQHRTKK
jgi:hypothetical protein